MPPKPILPITFKPKLFLGLYLTFIAMTIIGTMTYCLGGYFAVRSLGYNTKIHYAYVSYPCLNKEMTPFYDTMQSIRARYSEEMKNNQDFPEKEKYNAAVDGFNKIIHKGNFITSVSILTPVLIGTIGFILLIIFRRRYKDKSSLSFWQWGLIFKSLFWLRSSFMLVCGLIGMIIYKFGFSRLNDHHVSILFGWSPFLYPVLSGSIGLIILATVVFKFIPKEQRLTFLVSGLFGGISGIYLWAFLGKLILP